MGAELGATTSIFPSDEVTKAFLKAQCREADWIPLQADPDAVYDEVIDIDLSALKPLAACPHMPDNVKSVDDIGKIKIDQVCIGSCTNSSYLDLMRVAAILKGKTVHPDVSLSIAPGSKQVYTMLAENGALADLIAAGARILESACGPCIGMGQSPNSGGVSLRTFNRNFEGRSGTADAQVYLVSPETAAASALAGVFTNPQELGSGIAIPMPETFLINDNMVVPARPGGGDGQGRNPARAQYQGIPAEPASAGNHRGKGAAEGRGQHHHRPHHAGGRQNPALPFQYPLSVEFLLRRMR